MYSASLPYLWHGYKVFDILKAERFLFWNYYSIADSQFWGGEERTKQIILNWNDLSLT
jgi:hypothetical protein